MSVDPTTLSIVHFPSDILRRKADPVPELTDEVRSVARRMIELMFEAEGIGLAAPQVGLAWRLFVAHVPAGDGRSSNDSPPTASDEPCVFINPVLSDFSQMEPLEEGCLSLPGINGDVRRPTEVTICATGLDGVRFEARAGELLSRCWQHEVDHLDGVLIIDRFTSASRLKNRSAIKDLNRRVSST